MATARYRRGTDTVNEKVALSEGWSLQGNQPGEPFGSLNTVVPSWVLIQPIPPIGLGLPL